MGRPLEETSTLALGSAGFHGNERATSAPRMTIRPRTSEDGSIYDACAMRPTYAQINETTSSIYDGGSIRPTHTVSEEF